MERGREGERGGGERQGERKDSQAPRGQRGTDVGLWSENLVKLCAYAILCPIHRDSYQLSPRPSNASARSFGW